MSLVHILRLHAGYRCRHAGVCCTEDWAIPVEAPLHQRLSQALERSALRPEHQGARYFEPAEGLADASVVTGRVGRDCAFFEPNRGRLCAIHRQLGHEHLPSACQHFPRVVTVDPRGIFVSLSHVCPTAGRLLLEPFDAPFDLVHEGPVVTPGLEWTGLDARDALPPQVSAEVLWDWEALSAWELGVLDAVARSSPETAVPAIAVAASTLERWRPRAQTLAAAVATAFDAARFEPPHHRVDVGALDELARQSSPHLFPLTQPQPTAPRPTVSWWSPAWPAVRAAEPLPGCPQHRECRHVSQRSCWHPRRVHRDCLRGASHRGGAAGRLGKPPGLTLVAGSRHPPTPTASSCASNGRRAPRARPAERATIVRWRSRSTTRV